MTMLVRSDYLYRKKGGITLEFFKGGLKAGYAITKNGYEHSGEMKDNHYKISKGNGFMMGGDYGVKEE